MTKYRKNSSWNSIAFEIYIEKLEENKILDIKKIIDGKLNDIEKDKNIDIIDINIQYNKHPHNKINSLENTSAYITVCYAIEE